ncbi:MAG TPA: hypothetical protein PLH53_14730 [Ignavibacteriaceae bacterium]|nr:hypothetical protein [Ignavibacteriaceae bacterium]
MLGEELPSSTPFLNPLILLALISPFEETRTIPEPSTILADNK